MSSENYLTKQIREALALQPDVWIFRNQVAKVQHLADGRIEQVGAGLGSADLLGHVHGVFFWLEVKPPKGRHRDAVVIARQTAWQAVQRAKRGLGDEVTSVAQAMAVIEKARTLASLLREVDLNG